MTIPRDAATLPRMAAPGLVESGRGGSHPGLVGLQALRRLARAVLPRRLHPDRRLRIRPDLSLDRFFALLCERGVNYVVLRWFEELPHIEPGHDLDLLVADADLPRMTDLLTRGAHGQLCDLYSTVDRQEFTYRPPTAPPGAALDMAVFPTWLAERLLARAVMQSGQYRVPCAEDHLFSLGYHAAYLKGARSGLLSSLAGHRQGPCPSHDYAAVLTKLGTAQGLSLPKPLTLEALDDVLAEAGWRPPLDLLERLAPCHPWIAAKFFSAAGAKEEPGVTTFLLRDRVVDDGLAPAAMTLIEALGFEIIADEALEGGQQELASRQIRGGNWGPGPWPVSGGGPRRLLVALDLLPRPCRGEELTACPLLDNARIPEVKALLRTRIARLAPAAGRYNSLHSSDNSAAAWQMVRMLLPGDEMRLRALVGARRAEFATKEEVVADLTRYGNRAKVEVIRHSGGLAVKKTFRPHALRFLWRELDLYDRFAAEREELLPVLARGPNHFLLPYVEDRFGQASQRVGGRRPPRQLPLRAAQHMLSFLRHLLDRGYEPIDVTPANNVLIDAEGRLRIIDLEFVQRRGDAPIPADRSWSLHGAPDDFAGDLPAAGFYLGDPYPTEWFPFVGLSRASLLHDPTWLQHAKRMAHRPMILLHWAMGMARRAGPALARRARRLRAQTRRRG